MLRHPEITNSGKPLSLLSMKERGEEKCCWGHGGGVQDRSWSYGVLQSHPEMRLKTEGIHLFLGVQMTQFIAYQLQGTERWG